MRAKIGMAALVGVIGLAVIASLACAPREAKKEEAKKKEAAPEGMVLVPAGEFTMGMDADEALKECRKYLDDCKRKWFTNEEPVHQVYLDAFYIDKYEVTQGEYDKCVAAGKCEANEKYDGFTGSKQPVVGVAWEDAKTYCEWAGKRLPTEAEWEKAARGTDGRMYPWGNEFDGTKANFCDKNCENDWALKDQDDGYAKTAPVGSYPEGASPYGALDMTGNVWEWTADWYDYDEDYYRNSPAKNPKGPDTGTYRVLRGGGWRADPGALRVPHRSYLRPVYRYYDIGFRCSRD